MAGEHAACKHVRRRIKNGQVTELVDCNKDLALLSCKLNIWNSDAAKAGVRVG